MSGIKKLGKSTSLVATGDIAQQFLENTGLEEELYQIGRRKEAYTDPAAYEKAYATELTNLKTKIPLKFNSIYYKYRTGSDKEPADADAKTIAQAETAAATVGDKAIPSAEAKKLAVSELKRWVKTEQDRIKIRYPKTFTETAEKNLGLQGILKSINV